MELSQLRSTGVGLLDLGAIFGVSDCDVVTYEISHKLVFEQSKAEGWQDRNVERQSKLPETPSSHSCPGLFLARSRG